MDDRGSMDHEKFDQALIHAAMARADALGWSRVTVIEAAREAGLPLDEARERFPMRTTVLLRLGMLADRSALVDDGSTGTVRERLFDLVMRRIDVLQQYRGGVRAVLRAMPFDPALALVLTAATGDSMSWIAEAAGVDTTGLAGRLRVQGVIAVWLQTVRAWDRDDSPDLSGTMAALDRALDRAEWLGRMLSRPLFGRAAAMEAPDPADEVFLPDPTIDPTIPDPGPVDPLT
jgi:ubiquinone biosynthesis protein COQ9